VLFILGTVLLKVRSSLLRASQPCCSKLDTVLPVGLYKLRGKALKIELLVETQSVELFSVFSAARTLSLYLLMGHIIMEVDASIILPIEELMSGLLLIVSTVRLKGSCVRELLVRYTF
jgi:hypothetical protein